MGDQAGLLVGWPAFSHREAVRYNHQDYTLEEYSDDLDPYVIDVLMPDLAGHERSPAAFLIYLYLWQRTEAQQGRAVQASYATLALETGLSKVTAQRAIALLERRQLVGVTRSAPTAVPRYAVLRPWAARKRPE